MKRVWANYSYTIVLIAVSLVFSIIAKVHFQSPDDPYITVTIEEGQSLWEIADVFADEHKLSESEFVSWVQEQNGLKGGVIHPGDELVIPVMEETAEISQIAGADR